jgi:hypothetical protein
MSVSRFPHQISLQPCRRPPSSVSASLSLRSSQSTAPSSKPQEHATAVGDHRMTFPTAERRRVEASPPPPHRCSGELHPRLPCPASSPWCPQARTGCRWQSRHGHHQCVVTASRARRAARMGCEAVITMGQPTPACHRAIVPWAGVPDGPLALGRIEPSTVHSLKICFPN